MQLKKIFKAAFRIRNLALLAGVVIISYLTEYLPFVFIGAAGYIYFVIQTLNDKKFTGEYSENEKVGSIQELSAQCDDLYRQSRKVIDKQLYRKVNSIMQDKDEIMELFSKDEEDFIKQKLVEQAIKLTMAYINLMSDYSLKRREVATFDTNELVNGISNNEQKLQYLKDMQAIEDIRHAIEMDRKVLRKIGQEKNELERAGAKLAFIESTLTSFKHQTITSDNSDDADLEIENIINESTALDNVLNNNRKDSLKITQ